VDSTTPVPEVIFQKLATDWDFILSRAEFYGYVISPDGDDLVIGKPKLDGSAVLRVATGESIISFNAELNAERQPAGIDVYGWDIKTLALVKSTAVEPTMNAHGNLSAKTLSGKLQQKKLSLTANTPLTKDDLKAWADGNLMRTRLASLKGQVTFMGNALAMPNTIIDLEGVGDRYNGSAYVSAVTHTLEEGTWTTEAKFGFEAKSISEKTNFSYSPALGHLPGIQGLQVGTVKKLFEDPDSQFRILVNLSTNATSQDGVWARVANFYATSDAGQGFLPEVGDEVIIGFVENDPRYPVVLGSLYSSGRKAAATPADNNNYIKTIITKSKLKISFDDEKKITTIVTPGNNSIKLSDDAKSIEIVDQNNNSIKLTSGGIDLQSGKDINIKATGNISINATGKLNLAATQDCVISGMNVNQTAQVGFTAKGNATAELSASGQTTVKGGIVMIN
jgi:Rhs element Vgr protein